MNIKLTTTFALLFGISAMVTAQSGGGLYETSQDFINQKMEATTSITMSDADYITVVRNQQAHNLKKSNVFGYTDANNRTYRFVGNSRFLILNPSEETLLYQHESKTANNQVVTKYYFSRGAGDVLELTLANVKNAFAGNLEFHEALDAEFRNDAELASYSTLPTLAAILPVSEGLNKNSGLGQ